MDAYDLDQHDEDLTLLLHAWPDVEEAILRAAEEGKLVHFTDGKALADALRRAMRVEVQTGHDFLGGPALGYVLLYDVNDYAARQAAAFLTTSRLSLDSLTRKHAPIQGHAEGAQVRVVPSGKPVEGQVCPRVMATPTALNDLRDLPEPEPPRTDVPLVSRGLHQLTPIEAPFYDALQESGLLFAVQPRVQGDRTYRPDFIVFYAGRGVVVELDGHEGHKTRQQRDADARRELWFQERGLSVLRWTGTAVAADAQSCVEQLTSVLRGSRARP